MASLSKLASMTGWDLEGSEPVVESGTVAQTSARGTTPQCIAKNTVIVAREIDEELQPADERRGHTPDSSSSCRSWQTSNHHGGRPRSNSIRQPHDHTVGDDARSSDNDRVPARLPDRQQTQNVTSDDRLSKISLPSSAVFGFLDREDVINDTSTSHVSAGLSEAEVVLHQSQTPDSPRVPPPAKDGVSLSRQTSSERSMEPATTTDVDLAPSPVQRHPLDTLRKKTGDIGGGSGGGRGRRERCRDDVVNKLRAQLKREKEGRARERAGREVAEEEAGVARASLEHKAKRALELENRVRVLGMRITLSNSSDGGGGGGGGSSGANGDRRGYSGASAQWTGRAARSLSPESRVGAGANEGFKTEFLERHAQMTVVVDAAETAREEALATLEAMEGFASFNRKLIDELRTVVCNRDDLVGELSRERSAREQLEKEVDQLLGGGLAAAIEEKEEELEARCEQEREETKRVVALHNRMEQEYRLALTTLGRERERLKETVESLEEKLLEAHRAQKLSTKEEGERAIMCSEEVRAIRADLAPRAKRRGRHESSRDPYGKGSIVGRSGSGGVGGGRGGGKRGGKGSGGGGWLEAERMRIEAQRITEERIAIAVTEGRAKRASPERHQSPPMNDASIDSDHHHHSHHIAGNRTGRGGGGDQSHLSAPPRPGSGSSVGGWTANGKGGRRSACAIVQRAAVESVELFVGDFVPKAGPHLLEEAAARGAGDGSAAGSNKVSRWAMIGRAGKLSARATAVCAEEAAKAATAEANHRFRSVINSAARALMASFLSLVAHSASSRADAHLHISTASLNVSVGGGGDGSADGVSDATASAVSVRRLVQTCGLVRVGGGGPTLAHVDVKLQQNTTCRGRVGHRQFFKVIMALAECRFAGQPRDEALEKLSRIMHPPPSAPSRTAHVPKRQGEGREGKAAGVAGAGALTSGQNASVGTGGTASAGIAVEEAVSTERLIGAERVLERDRRALEAIFTHYSGAHSVSPDAGGGGPRLLRFVALTAFCRDFELNPGLVSREAAHRMYKQLAYPHETMLTLREVAARERIRESGAGGGTQTGCVAGRGLDVGQWMAWLGLVAVGCAWFDQQRGLYDTPTKKVLGLLQWMDGSAGKTRISSRRGATVIPAFNLLHPE